MPIKIGIEAIDFYTPGYYLDLNRLATARAVDPNKFQVGLGQKKMAVIPPDEDVVTMGAAAAHRLLEGRDRNPIEYLIFATETGVDQSKAAGLFVHRLLNLPERCRVLEVKQACYGATAALQLGMCFLQAHPDKNILLIASDIARYGLHSKGESSQGGGAVAMLLAQNPAILAIEPESGFYTEDTMDFFRPNYSEEAIVDGQYSCELYLKLLERTWTQYQERSLRSFSDHAHFCYHVPVPRLVEKAHQYLRKINHLPKLSPEDLQAVLTEALHYGRVIGNCYTAALYLSFIALLDQHLAPLSGQRIGFYSYGSGCMGEFFSGVLQAGYQRHLYQAEHQALLANRQALSVPEYEDFYCFEYPKGGQTLVLPRYTQGPYRLSAIEAHQRIYEQVD